MKIDFFTFFLECSGSIPATPSGASVSHDGGDTAGTVVTYTCADGHKVYAVVSESFVVRSEVIGTTVPSSLFH